MSRFPIVTSFAAALCLAVLSLAAPSCARIEPENVNELEKMAFDAWIEKYVIAEGIDVVEQSNGMYVEFIEDGNQSFESSRDTTVWMRIDYTSTDSRKNVFATRDSIEALRQRTFTPYTYYVPEYVFVGPERYGMLEGRYFALKNDLVKPDGSTMKIVEGSHVRLYLPSYLAYGSTGYSSDQGYGGQFPLGDTKIIIDDIEVREVVKDPIEREEKIVDRLVENVWNISLRDTITTKIYVDTVNFTPRPELLEKFPNKPFKKEYALDADSLTTIWFVGKFLPSAEYPDGFIFDTNIESVYNDFFNRRLSENYTANSKTFSARSYMPKDDRSSLPSAFYKAIPALRRGQWSRIVFTSAYGYGTTGLSAAIKQRQAYYQASMDYYMNYYMMNNMYQNGYYDNYYNNSYYSGYNDYYNYSPSYSEDSKDKQQITTEIQPYTPLIFEIYIETEDE